MRMGICCVFFGACLGCGVAVETESEVAREAARLDAFEADFEDCTEFAGIGLVPRANAEPFVPAGTRWPATRTRLGRRIVLCQSAESPVSIRVISRAHVCVTRSAGFDADITIRFFREATTYSCAFEKVVWTGKDPGHRLHPLKWGLLSIDVVKYLCYG